MSISQTPLSPSTPLVDPFKVAPQPRHFKKAIQEYFYRIFLSCPFSSSPKVGAVQLQSHCLQC